MSQVARNPSDAAEGFLVGKRYLIHDRDPLFTAEFLETLEASGVKSVKLPPRSPNLGNRLVMEEECCVGSRGAIQRRERLGGMLNCYYRQAA